MSFVLNGQPHVSPEARERVLRVVEEHNYRPSHAARALVAQRAEEICLVSPPEPPSVRANGYWGLLVTGVSKGCSNHRYYLSVSICPDPLADEQAYILPADSLYDGYIVFSKDIDERVMTDLLSRKKPVVLIEQHPSYPDACVVMIDNVEAARNAVNYLVNLGHKDIALVQGAYGAQVTHDRTEGYRMALESANVPFRDELVASGDFTETSGYEAVLGLLQGRIKPTAFFCESDGMAVGALLALHETGISVPEEVSVMGFGGYPRSAYTIPPLTTVRQPVVDLGEAAAELMIDLIEGSASGQTVRCLPAPLIERGTCGPVAQ